MGGPEDLEILVSSCPMSGYLILWIRSLKLDDVNVQYCRNYDGDPFPVVSWTVLFLVSLFPYFETLVPTRFNDCHDKRIKTSERFNGEWVGVVSGIGVSVDPTLPSPKRIGVGCLLLWHWVSPLTEPVSDCCHWCLITKDSMINWKIGRWVFLNRTSNFSVRTQRHMVCGS